jgi:adenine phosphoribosyltransferase
MSFFNNFNGIKIDAVAGIESRGFLIGPIIANYFKVPFILIRKKGKLPGETVSMQYDLEYGSAEIEIQKSSIQPSSNILIHDDLLATGGTASAAAKLIKKMGANIAGFCFIINLSDLQGLTTLKHYNAPIVNLVNF